MTLGHKTACIIGAGSSGITAAQVLAANGIDFDCFEISSDVGGNWRYDNDNGVSSAYRSLHINTSTKAMEYAAFPMPDELPATRATGRSRRTSTTSCGTSGCATRSPSGPRSRGWCRPKAAGTT
jgi:cation diffusion facilitator CzcD-associated flavoprotein CzcO